jgi:phosphoadenosine phosphosulfate reductase
LSSALYDTLKTASKITDSVIVGFSGGKDSVAALDLCFRYFKRVQPYFMYIVPNLEFQERTLHWYEQKYNAEIIRMPHFMLSEFLRYGSYRFYDLSVPIVKTVESYNYLREVTGIYWICAGERIKDSIIRRAMIKESGSIDDKRGRIYPIAYWSKAEVLAYNKAHKLPMSLETKTLGFSFRSLMPLDMLKVKRTFPKDYEKIKAFFPLIEASAKRGEMIERNEISEIRDGNNPPRSDQGG